MILTREDGTKVERMFGSALGGESFKAVEFSAEEINLNVIMGGDIRTRKGLTYINHLLTCRMVYGKTT